MGSTWVSRYFGSLGAALHLCTWAFTYSTIHRIHTIHNPSRSLTAFLPLLNPCLAMPCHAHAFLPFRPSTPRLLACTS